MTEIETKRTAEIKEFTELCSKLNEKELKFLLDVAIRLKLQEMAEAEENQAAEEQTEGEWEGAENTGADPDTEPETPCLTGKITNTRANIDPDDLSDAALALDTALHILSDMGEHFFYIYTPGYKTDIVNDDTLILHEYPRNRARFNALYDQLINLGKIFNEHGISCYSNDFFRTMK